MTIQEIQHTMTQLETIQSDARTLRATVAEQAPDLDIQPVLTRIWTVSMDLKRRLCTRKTVDGYRDDAMAQVARVWELAGECGLDPDDLQFVSIGYACDLAAEKIKHYQRMVNFAAQLEALTGEPITEGA